ncbi:MAG: aminotransferase class I/II-fold pyridoxal phosphate-dependent enzyme [Alphaproteobacteria bacterium]|nr:aminotransferase class I/II-fold pyridoxal phosphate-dependent enzyme [Alphaproteobacteria bacterium]
MSNWAPDLTNLDGPRYQALADAIDRAVGDGRLKPGDRLPTRRQLADALSLSVHTVSAAYLEAERRGLVTGTVGKGTFVCAPPAARDIPFLTQGRPADLIDLSVCRPCIEPLHAERLRATLADLAAGEDLASMLVCRPIIGLARHRAAAAQWLAGFGLAASPDCVLITNGCAHALTVALSTLTGPGDLVATERLTDHGTISLASVLHFNLLALETDDEGIVPDALDAACRAAPVKVLVTTPTLNNPTSTLMSEARRREVAEIARRHGLTIVENDIFRPLVPEAPPPLAALAPDITCYATSFTKSTVSGLRTGYLLVPAPLVVRMVARLRTTSWMGTPLVAEIASRWIEDGTMAELVGRQRRELAWRQQLVHGLMGGETYATAETSINVWMSLPPPWRVGNFVDYARQSGVAVIGPEPFMVDRTPVPHCIRISIGAAQDRAQLEAGLRLLRDILAQRAEPVPIDL